MTGLPSNDGPSAKNRNAKMKRFSGLPHYCGIGVLTSLDRSGTLNTLGPPSVLRRAPEAASGVDRASEPPDAGKTGGGETGQGGEVVHLVSQSREKVGALPDRGSLKTAETRNPRIAALRVDFVAKPANAAEIHTAVTELIVRAELHREGLESSMLVVSDRESRLVTLLTLWDAGRFEKAKERLTAWMQRLVADLAEGPIRAHTGVAHVLDPKSSAKLTLADLRPDELAELVDIANAE